MSAYETLQKRHFINHKLGALGSPAWWAARGERSDGRNNNLDKYQPDYADSDWGFRYSDVHNNATNLCTGNNSTGAQWVYQFGLWIDNHQLRDKNDGLFNAKFDRFHPTLASALPAEQCSSSNLNVGYWDDSGSIANLQVSHNGNLIATMNNLDNGIVNVDLGSVNADDSIWVMVEDATGNRQQYQTSYDELQFECEQRQPQGGSLPVWFMLVMIVCIQRRYR